MRKCKNCKKEIEEDIILCPFCKKINLPVWLVIILIIITCVTLGILTSAIGSGIVLVEKNENTAVSETTTETTTTQTTTTGTTRPTETTKSPKQLIEEFEEEQKQQQKADFKSACRDFNYNEIQRNPENFKNNKIKIYGTIIQVSEGWFNTVTFRVKDSNGNVWYISYSYSDGESRFLENDKVNVYGTSTGTETYTTVLGNSVTIPSISAKYIEN